MTKINETNGVALNETNGVAQNENALKSTFQKCTVQTIV